jgi:hypothetical protein
MGSAVAGCLVRQFNGWHSYCGQNDGLLILPIYYKNLEYGLSNLNKSSIESTYFNLQ